MGNGGINFEKQPKNYFNVMTFESPSSDQLHKLENYQMVISARQRIKTDGT